jgi:hypothetical protein
MSELTREQINSIEADCLRTISAVGCVPDGKTLRLASGSLGIGKLGAIDFLSKLGYVVIWRKGK